MRLLAALVSVLVLASCGGDDDASPPTATSTSEAGTSPVPSTTMSTDAGPRVVIATEEGEVVFDVELAEREDEWQVGLMHREYLPPDSGMLFLFPEDRRGGFWMKNTLIPLSIAFASRDGTIVSILDMEPCRQDPCEVYDPGVAYRSALEVNRGAFADLGVETGDRIRLER